MCVIIVRLKFYTKQINEKHQNANVIPSGSNQEDNNLSNLDLNPHNMYILKYFMYVHNLIFVFLWFFDFEKKNHVV